MSVIVAKIPVRIVLDTLSLEKQAGLQPPVSKTSVITGVYTGIAREADAVIRTLSSAGNRPQVDFRWKPKHMLIMVQGCGKQAHIAKNSNVETEHSLRSSGTPLD